MTISPERPNLRALRAVFTNEVIRAIGTLARQPEVCREQDGKTVFVMGINAAREYLIEHVLVALLPVEREAPATGDET